MESRWMIAEALCADVAATNNGLIATTPFLANTCTVRFGNRGTTELDVFEDNIVASDNNSGEAIRCRSGNRSTKCREGLTRTHLQRGRKTHCDRQQKQAQFEFSTHCGAPR